MINELIVTGKTIDEAIEAGCAELNLDRDSVSVEVIEAPSKALFGFKTVDAKVKLTYETKDTDKAADFLSAVFKQMGLEATIESKPTEDGMFIELSGPDMGIVIGRRGETLDALQYLTSLVVNKDEKDYIKVTIDTENYRGKREETLVRLARKLASKVVKYRRNVTLEPMNPYERRIIHSTLQNVENISTTSNGVDPNRKVVINYTGSDPAPERKDFGGRGPRRDGPRRDGPRRDGPRDGRQDFKKPYERRDRPMAAAPTDENAPKVHKNDKDLFNKIYGEK